MKIKEKINKLPDNCGVYIMKSKGGETLYVGKATSIKKRVQSHFATRSSQRASLFTEKVNDVEYILCDTEEQALILEASLIKEKQPRYNVELKDDKSYPYVVATKGAYPHIYIARLTQVKAKGARFFGPFTNVKLLKKALKLIRKIFPYCSCSKPRKSCLYYHMKLCPGPGISDITVSQYKENIDNIYKVLSGERKELLEKLQGQMDTFAQQAQFEKAADVRDQLVALYTLYSGKRQVNELLILKEILRLKKIPFIIEAIDISSLFGQASCGSVVVFKDGIPHKDGYRRYRIKEVAGIDDYKMIAEVVRRRYRRLKNEEAILPNLIIIDGGYAHANVAKRELAKLALQISVIGIAKKNEEIWFPQKKRPLIIPHDSPALQLVQRIRDEAHRFAHKYHFLLRKKRLEGV
jgi:excinuclease ABC subunit C